MEDHCILFSALEREVKHGVVIAHFGCLQVETLVHCRCVLHPQEEIQITLLPVSTSIYPSQTCSPCAKRWLARFGPKP